MTPQLLREHLEKKYNVLACVDLASLTVAPNSAYTFFKQLFRVEYQDSDRIVLYTSRSIPESLVAHIQKTLNDIDIGAWFVLFCTPVAVNVSDCQNLVVPLKETTELCTGYYLPDTICAVPWNNVEIRIDGKMTPCCMSKGLTLGSIDQISIVDAFNSTPMQELRQDLLSGIKSPVCTNCWAKEDRGLTSIRQHNIKRLNDSFLSNQLNCPTITSLDIKFHNTCNFKCIICDSSSSSAHAQEQATFFNIPVVKQSEWSESDQFINQVNALLPTLENIDMYGGEPFLIKGFARVLKTAVEQGYAKNIRLHYNSNGSIFPNELVKYWPMFREVDIHFSIDAVGKQFEYQRGGTWEEVDANIQRIKNLKFPNLKISIMPSISIMNVLYIDQVLDWANQHNFPIFVSHVTQPPVMGLNNLTPAAQKLVLEKHQNNSWPEMRKIVELVSHISNPNSQGFCDYIRQFDIIRKQNFSNHHQEIADAMGYTV